MHIETSTFAFTLFQVPDRNLEAVALVPYMDACKDINALVCFLCFHRPHTNL
jgi:hypothetical protein